MHRGAGIALGVLLASLSLTAVQAQDCLYVLNHLNGAVEIVNRATNTGVVTLALPDCPQLVCNPIALALTPDASRAYIARFDADTVQVLEPSTLSVIATVSVGNGPSAIALRPDGGAAYVANFNSDSVSVIATDSNQVLGTIQVGNGPNALAITPDGTTLFVGNSNDKDISVIRVADGASMSPPIAVPASPAGMAVSPDGTRLYVSNDAVGPVTGSVSVINVATLAVIDTIPVGHLPRAIAFTPDGSVAYVTNRQDGTVTPIETRSDTTGNPIAVDAGPLALAISDDGATVYVANGNSSTVSVIDTASGSVSTIEQLPAPFDLALGPCPGHPQVCAGDCNGDGMVGINELIIGVNIALGTQPASACTAVDVDGNAMVTINELVRAVSSALNGCTA